MSNIAYGGGSIRWNRRLTNEDLLKAIDILEKAFSTTSFESAVKNAKPEGPSELDLFSDGNYYETEVFAVLNELKDTIPGIAEGCITYNSEYGDMWCLDYEDGKWIEKTGHIWYDEDPAPVSAKIVVVQERDEPKDKINVFPDRESAERHLKDMIFIRYGKERERLTEEEKKDAENRFSIEETFIE